MVGNRLQLYKNKNVVDKLTATYTFDFTGKEGMLKEFRNTWSDDKRWDFNTKPNTAIFTFK